MRIKVKLIMPDTIHDTIRGGMGGISVSMYLEVAIQPKIWRGGLWFVDILRPWFQMRFW